MHGYGGLAALGATADSAVLRVCDLFIRFGNILDSREKLMCVREAGEKKMKGEIVCAVVNGKRWCEGQTNDVKLCFSSEASGTGWPGPSWVESA